MAKVFLIKIKLSYRRNQEKRWSVFPQVIQELMNVELEKTIFSVTTKRDHYMHILSISIETLQIVSQQFGKYKKIWRKMQLHVSTVFNFRQ